jgi:NADH-quinone oxidoreductase subunit M
MPDPGFLLVALALVLLLAGAAAARRARNARAYSIGAAAGALLSLLAAAQFQGDELFLAMDDSASVPAIMAVVLMLAVALAAPSRDLDGSRCARMLAALAGVITLYTAQDSVLLFAGWVFSAVPLLYGGERAHRARSRWYASPAVALMASVALVGVAVGTLTLAPAGTAGFVGFTLLVVGAMIRSGLFPFHSWVAASFESENFLPYAWLLSARTGVFLIARFTTAEFATTAGALLPALSNLALFSSVLMAVMALGEKVPRRVLALVVLSQSGFIVSGLQSRNLEGITGALLQWVVVSISTVGLAMVLRAVEVRYGTLANLHFAGLISRIPRFAVFFLLLALALVGLPGTLGFCAEDLLFHGALEVHPVLGLALPFSTALIAIRLLGMFSTMFLGRREHLVPATSDALPRERWVLTALAVFLVIAGLLPAPLVRSRTSPAQAMLTALGTNHVAARH